MKIVKIGFIAVFLSFFLFTLPVQAVPIILDFSTGGAGTGETLTFSGAAGAGVNIPINILTVTGTSFDGVYDVDGAFSFGAGTETAALLSFDPDTNTITLVGSIPKLGINTPTTLLTITFSDFVTVGGDIFLAFDRYYPDSQSYIVTSTPITKNLVTNSTVVPEPTTLILLGLGLTGIGLYRRIRKHRIRN